MITKTHAPVAERQLRTIKDMLHKRMEHSEDKECTDHIGYVLLTYNHKMKHRVTGMTPYDAKKEKNHLVVSHKLQLRARHNRRYPELSVGDKVKIYIKKKRFEKERVSVWSKEMYKVERIDDLQGQYLYKTSSDVKPFMRHELLKI